MEFVTIVADDLPGGTAVLAKRDYDPAVHTLAGRRGSGEAPAPVAPAAGGLAGLAAAEAVTVVAQATSIEALTAMALEEAGHPRFEGGRATVLKAIEARKAKLAEG